MFAYFNPIQLNVDPLTLLWLNAFALNLQRSVKMLSVEQTDPPYLDVKIEAIMFRVSTHNSSQKKRLKLFGTFFSVCYSKSYSFRWMHFDYNFLSIFWMRKSYVQSILFENQKYNCIFDFQTKCFVRSFFSFKRWKGNCSRNASNETSTISSSKQKKKFQTIWASFFGMNCGYLL